MDAPLSRRPRCRVESRWLSRTRRHWRSRDHPSNPDAGRHETLPGDSPMTSLFRLRNLAVALALVSAGGCKPDSAKNADKAAGKVVDKQEDLRDKREDLAEKKVD